MGVKKTAAKQRRALKSIKPDVKDDLKSDSYYTATRLLVRHIEPQHLSGKRPRVVPAAFCRDYSEKDGKIEDYLSVNCEGLDNLDEILEFYFKTWGHSPTHYVRHKIEKINAAANNVKTGTISFDREVECYRFMSSDNSRKPAYTHKPKGNGESYSHSGIMFYPALGELGEFELADALTINIKPAKHIPKPQK